MIGAVAGWRRSLAAGVLATGMLVGGCEMADGITAPAPGDLGAIQRPASPNTALAGPAGFMPMPNLPTRRYNVPPDRLFAAVRTVIAARPRTVLLGDDMGRRRTDHVERSLVFRFPDIVLAQVLATDDGQSDLIIYSYSLKGHYDFGVNRRRVAAILSALDTALMP